ncbi:MAG: PIN domain-containing protein [Syntrophomonas sp.]|uniref:type II toxin-antitoxin system VapC family toxin n=1 Tax=Syntrophomonas sp. TaxID=2053627 RepID=UPI002606A55D|nr:PIN domain-containing protein [Syntrophomonas sp.]MDD4626504.1 PIN domain-containing protein [Syntrophomonas sp.]
MILVDTSVLIGFLKGQINEKIQLFDQVLSRNIDFGFSSYTFQEVLQGTQNEKEYEKLRDYLSTQIIYFLPEKTATYEKAARLYFDLRRKGITPRSTIDVLIALTAIENNLLLLHNDRDFDLMAEQIETLDILKMI